MENSTKNNAGQTLSEKQNRSVKQHIREKIFSSKEIEREYHFKFARKIIHISFSLFGFGFLFLPGSYKPYEALLLYGLTLLSFIGDTIRIFVPSLNQFVYKYLGMMFIKRDEKRYSSGTYYLIGATIATILFPYKIAGMSIIFLGIGDFMASLGGTYLKKFFPYKLPKTHKTYIGLLCFVLSTTLIGVFAHVPLFPCFIASLCAALSEVYLVNIDDNLTIPIVGGAVLYLLLGAF